MINCVSLTCIVGEWCHRGGLWAAGGKPKVSKRNRQRVSRLVSRGVLPLAGYREWVMRWASFAGDFYDECISKEARFPRELGAGNREKRGCIKLVQCSPKLQFHLRLTAIRLEK